jgi:hypothetical protein
VVHSLLFGYLPIPQKYRFYKCFYISVLSETEKLVNILIERCPADDYINLLAAPRQEIFPSQVGLDILLEKRLNCVAGQGNVIWEIQDEIIKWFWESCNLFLVFGVGALLFEHRRIQLHSIQRSRLRRKG